MSASGSAEQHHQWAAEQQRQVRLAIVTVSDSRTPATDTNYHYLLPQIESLGHLCVGYQIVKDEPEQISTILDQFAPLAQIILFNGGTGISRRDSTFDTLARKLEKTLVGFGELFRMLSWQQIGAAAMLSRAVAGTYRGCVIISTPGSPHAVQLAWEQLICPELNHLAWELTR